MGGVRSVLAAFAALGVFWGGWAVLIPSVQSAIGASKGSLGLALLGVGVGSLPAMLAVGRLIDRGTRGVLPTALLVFAGATLVPAFAGSVPALLGAMLLIGACSGAVDVAMNAEASALENESGRRLMQLAHGFFSLGLIAGAVASGLLRQAGVGLLGVLAVLGAVQLVAAVANRRTTARPRPASNSLLRRKTLRGPLLLLGLACAASFMIESGIESWSALFMQRELDAGAAVSAAGPASYAAAMASGRLLGHRLTRLDERALLTGGAVVALAGLAVASVAQSVPVAAVAFFAGGMGVSVAAPTLFGAAGRFGGATAVASVTTVGYLGFVIGPPLVGGLAQAIGLRGSFAALAAVAALLALGTPRLALGARAAD